MERIKLSSPAEVIINGNKYLFESGDTISIKSPKDLINEEQQRKLTAAQEARLSVISVKLSKLYATVNKENEAINKLSKRSEDPEITDIDVDRIQAKRSVLVDQRDKHLSDIKTLEGESSMVFGELEAAGYTKERLIQAHKEFASGIRQEAEEEDQRKQLSKNDQESKDENLALDQARNERDQFMQDLQDTHGKVQLRDDGFIYRYDPNAVSETETVDNKGLKTKKKTQGKWERVKDEEQNTYDDLDGKVSELEQEFAVAYDPEDRPKKTEEAPTPEQTHEIMSPDAFNRAMMSDEPGELADVQEEKIGDEISAELIDSDFMPGILYSKLLTTSAEELSGAFRLFEKKSPA